MASSGPNFEIYDDQVLGAGSYGKVCKAKYGQLPCAAKLLHDMFKSNDRGVKKFEQECQFLSGIRHPNIVLYLRTVRHPQSSQRLALLMELMDESLTNLLERATGPLPYHIQFSICYDVALALSYLHSNAIIHRDLSSNNVLLIGEGIRAKVADLGMSKLMDLDPRKNSLTTCPGSQVYMPPEALTTKPHYSSKLDCFSHGVLTIQILTRNFPNPGDAHRSVEDSTEEVQIKLPETERRKNDIDLIESSHPLLPLALHCLHNRATERPSADEVCEKLATLKREERYTHSVEQTRSLIQILLVQKEQAAQQERTSHDHETWGQASLIHASGLQSKTKVPEFADHLTPKAFSMSPKLQECPRSTEPTSPEKTLELDDHLTPKAFSMSPKLQECPRSTEPTSPEKTLELDDHLTPKTFSMSPKLQECPRSTEPTSPEKTLELDHLTPKAFSMSPKLQECPRSTEPASPEKMDHLTPKAFSMSPKLQECPRSTEPASPEKTLELDDHLLPMRSEHQEHPQSTEPASLEKILPEHQEHPQSTEPASLEKILPENQERRRSTGMASPKKVRELAAHLLSKIRPKHRMRRQSAGSPKVEHQFPRRLSEGQVLHRMDFSKYRDETPVPPDETLLEEGTTVSREEFSKWQKETPAHSNELSLKEGTAVSQGEFSKWQKETFAPSDELSLIKRTAVSQGEFLLQKEMAAPSDELSLKEGTAVSQGEFLKWRKGTPAPSDEETAVSQKKFSKWREEAHAPSDELSLKEGTAVSHGNFVYVSCKCNVYSYAMHEKKWTTLKQPSSQYFAMAVVKDKLIIIGGWSTETNSDTNALFFHPTKCSNSVNWKEDYHPMPTKRSLPAAATYDKTHIIVAGGWQGEAHILTNAVEVLDTSIQPHGQWFIANTLPKPTATVYPLQMTLCGRRLFFPNYSCSIDDLMKSRRKSASTSKSGGSSLPIQSIPSDFSAFPMVTDKDRVLAIGGYHDERSTSPVNSVRKYDQTTNSWNALERLPTPLGGALAATIHRSSELVVVGGCGFDGNQSNSTFIFLL